VWSYRACVERTEEAAVCLYSVTGDGDLLNTEVIRTAHMSKEDHGSNGQEH